MAGLRPLGLPPWGRDSLKTRCRAYVGSAHCFFNLRGKSLEDLARVWDLVGLAGAEVIALQELGGLPVRCPSHDTILHHEIRLAGRSFTFFYCDPSHSFRGSAIGVPSDWVHRIDLKTTFSTGLGVTLKHQGVRQFLMTAHLPHDLRADCLSVWQRPGRRNS